MNIAQINKDCIQSHKDGVLILFPCDPREKDVLNNLVNPTIHTYDVDLDGNMTLKNQYPMEIFFVNNSENAIMGVFATQELAESFRDNSAFGYYSKCKITSTNKDYLYWYDKAIKKAPKNMSMLWIGDDLR